MQRIWKWPLALSDNQAIDMPEDAMVLFVADQGGSPTIWTRNSPDAPSRRRNFCVRGTGHPIPDGAEYHGSCQSGPFVWHVFEMPS